MGCVATGGPSEYSLNASSMYGRITSSAEQAGAVLAKSGTGLRAPAPAAVQRTAPTAARTAVATAVAPPLLMSLSLSSQHRRAVPRDVGDSVPLDGDDSVRGEGGQGGANGEQAAQRERKLGRTHGPQVQAARVPPLDDNLRRTTRFVALIGDDQLPSASSRRQELLVEGYSCDRPRGAVAVPDLDRTPPRKESTTGRG